eukprot:8762120-Pyramimonas_sp.AAC.1
MGSTFGTVKAFLYSTTTGHGVPRTKTRPGPPFLPAGVSVSVLKVPSVLMENKMVSFGYIHLDVLVVLAVGLVPRRCR